MERACDGGHIGVLEVLVEYGAPAYVSSVDDPRFGHTTMHRACRAGHAHVCEWLINHGAPLDSINEKTRYGSDTPVCMCVCW